MTNPAATILIVDDEIQNCRLLETLLQPEGYLTLSAASGKEALAAIAQRAPDLILLDVMMPDMDGCQLASALKADPATSNIPIIMVTVQSDRSSRLAALDAGAEEFLTKPVDRAELWLRVRNLLRLKEFSDFLRDITERKAAHEVLQKRAAELEQFHRLSVGRELQMVELKKQVNKLATQAGQKPPYDLAFLDEQAEKTNPGH